MSSRTNLRLACFDLVPAVGAGALEVELTRGRSAVTRLFARAPLKLLAPRNHGDAAWVFASTLGGGFVDGDRVALDVSVKPGARAVLGTQASTKVYRAERASCRQELTARVGDGALLVCAPDHVTCFSGARYEQRLAIELAATASLVLVDAFTAGRVARGERWAFARYASRISIARAGVPVLEDAVILDPAEGDLAARFGRFDALATIVVLGPQVASLLPQTGPQEPPARRADLVEAMSPLPGGALVRVAGTSVERVVRRTRAVLAGLGPLLGDDLFARRW